MDAFLLFQAKKNLEVGFVEMKPRSEMKEISDIRVMIHNMYLVGFNSTHKKTLHSMCTEIARTIMLDMDVPLNSSNSTQCFSVFLPPT